MEHVIVGLFECFHEQCGIVAGTLRWRSQEYESIWGDFHARESADLRHIFLAQKISIQVEGLDGKKVVHIDRRVADSHVGQTAKFTGAFAAGAEFFYQLAVLVQMEDRKLFTVADEDTLAVNVYCRRTAQYHRAFPQNPGFLAMDYPGQHHDA